MSDLKACPCCGSERVRLTKTYDTDGTEWHYVECADCGLRTRGKWVSTPDNTCPIFFEEVRSQWNHRKAAARIEELENCADEIREEAYDEGRQDEIAWGADIGRACLTLAREKCGLDTDLEEFTTADAVAGSIYSHIHDLELSFQKRNTRIEELEANQSACDESFVIGKRDGYQDAVQDIDILTGGDGEFICVLGPPDPRHCPDEDKMKARIKERFEAQKARIEELESQLARAVEVATFYASSWYQDIDAELTPEGWVGSGTALGPMEPDNDLYKDQGKRARALIEELKGEKESTNDPS